jgi:hypothetical protein
MRDESLLERPPKGMCTEHMLNRDSRTLVKVLKISDVLLRLLIDGLMLDYCRICYVYA